MTALTRDFWHKQTAGRPLYTDLLWSRPEQRGQAGKLLIIGGNVQGFAAAGEAYQAASQAGIGTVRMLLPDSLRKLLGRDFAAGEYGPTTPSGSFSRQALEPALEMAAWADGVLVAGDLGRNSETAIMLEKFAAEYHGQLTLTLDAADYVTSAPGQLLERANTLLVISLAQLQKLAVQARYTTAFTFDMDMLRFVDALHEFTGMHQLQIIVGHLDTTFVASDGQVSSTRISDGTAPWSVRTAAQASTWWLQHPGKTFEALTTAMIADQAG